MKATDYVRPMLLFTGIISLIQAIAWFIMSLLGVLAYRCELTVPDPDTDSFTSLLYYLYFQGYKCQVPLDSLIGLPIGANLTVALYADPDYIQSWMAAYLAFDITYIIISVAMLVGYCRVRDSEVPSKTVRLWSLNTLILLIMDFWLTIVWGVEYRNLGSFVDKYGLSNSFGWAPSVAGALMAVTARGFILWVINLALFIYFARIGLAWGVFNRCLTQPIISHSDGRSRDDRIPRVRKQPYHYPEPYDNSQAVVPYRQTPQQQRGYYNEGMVETSFNDGYPQRHWESNRPPMVDPPTQSRQYPRYDRDDDFDILPGPSISHQDQHYSERGRPNARTFFDNKDRKNFEQGHGSPRKSYGAPSRAPQGARHVDTMY